MDHGKHLVDLVNETGQVVAQKQRRDIDKTKDVYHAVHTLMITPWGELVLGLIPERRDLPNLYATRLGVTSATIRRSAETADQAALRSLARELFLEGVELYHLGDSFQELPKGFRAYLSAYYFIATPPRTYSQEDINSLVVVTPDELRDQLAENPSKFAPTLQAYWEAYQDRLPV